MVTRVLAWCLGLLVASHVGWAVRTASLAPGNWPGCTGSQRESSNVRVNTEQQLQSLRHKMRDEDVDAYIIIDGDFHLNEFMPDHYKRVQFISGFTGTAEMVVVTQSAAVLATNDRFHLQAEQQLGCNWILVRGGVDTVIEWLEQERVKMQKEALVVGACPYYFPINFWIKLDKTKVMTGIRLKPVWKDLILRVWTKNRPALPSTPINVLPLKYTGVHWSDKVKHVQTLMTRSGVDLLVVTSLDEIAWLLNMRASDISGDVNVPVFYSLLIVRQGDHNPILYLKDHERKLDADPTDPVSNVTIRQHLNLPDNGVCADTGAACVKVREYDNENGYSIFFRELGQLVRDPSVKRIWISGQTNYGVYASFPQGKLYMENFPVSLLKATKNSVEMLGMKDAHIRDAVALARFMEKLETEVHSPGTYNWSDVTELTASQQLSHYRSLQTFSRGDSFRAISSFGPNSATHHYIPTESTNLNITTESFYLLDSGGQYLDGTTDVSRTFLFRDPTALEKEYYTRVLMGQIDLTTAVFERGYSGVELDVLARSPLWDVGLVYPHDTGHGIGHYLNIHEGPAHIGRRDDIFTEDVQLTENMFFSNEPGYYEDGKFGIRLENIMYVTKANTKYAPPSQLMLTFKTVTLFPYEPHLIEWNMLSDEQVSWLEAYHDEVENTIGPLLQEQEDLPAFEWLVKRTRARSPEHSGYTRLVSCLSLVLICVLSAVYAKIPL